jgi:hypothetical protein
VNRKRFTGPPHPDRDKQFRIITKLRKRFKKRHEPVISADTKKKELIGNFKNDGRVWAKQPEEVNAHDFPSDATARAVPYAIYDVSANKGFVGVGLSGDTPRFAVTVMTHWWREIGQYRYSGAKNLLLLVDSGGSNACRSHGFKHHLHRMLAVPYDLNVTVAHYPRGASKWNPVEHRLLSAISANWAGVPLRDISLVLNYIRSTRTKTGLTVEAELMVGNFETGEKIGASEWKALQSSIRHGKRCPDWNYTIQPMCSIQK